MIRVLAVSWPLLMGVMFLMVGNGIQSSLLGIRGTLEGFSTVELSIVTSCYYLGFLAGAQLTPALIRRVGHVRVFAALGSMISAVLVIYPVWLEWPVWSLLRVLIGFGFSGIYITAESWLNNTATNETRGQALSAYMIVQLLGQLVAQSLLNVADPGGFVLFVIPSVLVSLAFLPVLLADTPTPTFETTQSLSFVKLFKTSPLGCVGMFVTGGIFSAMFGMASVWGTMVGLPVRDITMFIGAMSIGGLLLQYPVGWLSDHYDRRRIIFGLCVLAACVSLLATIFPLSFVALIAVGMLLGGIINPLYSLLIAYTNDFLAKEDMAGASSGLIFLNGLGAIGGPIFTGWLIDQVGGNGFFMFIGFLFAVLGAYAAWRMTRRSAPVSTGSYTTLVPTASALAVGAVIEQAEELPPHTHG